VSERPAPLPRGIRRLFRLARRRPPVEREVRDEIDFHLAMRAAELVRSGLTPRSAEVEARRRFGDTGRWTQALSAVDRQRYLKEARVEWLADLRQDLHYAMRALRRAPLFALLAIVTLALGIGANAAVFGVVKSVLLDALPYADADRLVRVHGRTLDGAIERAPMSAGTLADIRDRQRSFSRLAGFDGQPREMILTGSDGPSVITALWVEPQLFATLGVTAARGRVLVDEDAAADTIRNILLTHATWQRLFGGDPAAVGKALVIGGTSRTIVGILPRGFVGPNGDVDIYVPFSLRGVLAVPRMARQSQFLGVVGRLRPRVTVDAASREVGALAADLARQYPASNGTFGAWATPIRDDMVGDTRTPLLVLMASAGLVLLITCANLAGALLSRTLTRRRELAVRVALGAGRGRLVRQLLTESAVLGLLGGAAGVGLAWLGLRALRGLALPSLPAYADLSLDGQALAVTAAAALATGLAFGLVPALAGSRASQEGVLREEGRAATESRRSRRLRGLLVAGQIALCLSLLAGAGLLARSLWAMTTAPLGFQPDGVLTMAVQLPRAGYSTPAARVRLYDELEQRLGALPGVTGVAITGEAPTQIRNRNGFVADGGAVALPGETRAPVLYSTVSDDFFRTLGIPLRAGRAFGPQDEMTAPTAIIINESLARHYWPKGDAVGQRVRLGPGDQDRASIVGVVGDVREDPGHAPEPVLYMSTRQNPWNGPVLILRTTGDPLALTKPVQRALASIDSRLPTHKVIALHALVGDRLSGRRLPTLLMAAFGVLALVLATVGVYAMFAAMGAAREREFGVRVALGSSPGEIARLVLRQGGVWMLVGLAGGAVGVVAVGRMLGGLLYGVAPLDPLVLGFAVALLVVCAAVALLVPVRRATRVDPISVLR
jgi:putative ABC transport system permease protein